MHVLDSTRRRTTMGIVALAAVVMTSACGIDRVGGGTAAQIGSVRLSRSSVVEAVDRVLATANPKPQRQDVSDALLTRRVQLALFRDEARKLGAALTDEDRTATRTSLDTQHSAEGGLTRWAQTLGMSQADVSELIELGAYQRVLSAKLIKDRPVTDAELEAVKKSKPRVFADQAHVAIILFNDEATATKVLAELKAGGDFAALAAKYSGDQQSAANGGDVGLVAKGALPAWDGALFSAKNGDTIGPVDIGGGIVIAKLIELRRYADHKDEIRDQAGSVLIGPARLVDEINRGPAVTVNPRFGRWDKASLSVLPSDNSKDDPSAPRSTTSAPVSSAPPQ
ncbi:MAG: peptidylprolyl isomerase [Actinomycetota bacterium]